MKAKIKYVKNSYNIFHDCFNEIFNGKTYTKTNLIKINYFIYYFLQTKKSSRKS